MEPKDRFPQSRNFRVLTHVIFKSANKLEAKSREHVKVERRSTFTFKCYLSCIAAIIFERVKFTFVRHTEKLSDSGNPT